MGSLWRSEHMQLVQLFVQIEAAHDTVDELGALGVIQFRDLNPNVNAFHRNFVNEVKRCDEMERKVRFFEEQVTKEKGLAKILNQISIENAATNSASLNVDELENRFDELEKELIQLNSNQQMLDRNQNELVELQHVLSTDSVFFASSGASFTDPDMKAPLLAEAQAEAGIAAKAVKLGYITGVINRSKVASFERVLWRATRGNLFMRQEDIGEAIKDPQSGEMLQKNVFIIFFQGERLQAKIKKICESFGATLYPCPETDNERRELLQQVQGRLADLEVVLSRSHEHRKQVLSGVATHLMTWKAKVLKEKAIFHTMNMFNYDIGRKCLIAEGWCPQTATDDIQLALRRATQRSNALVPSILSVIQSDEVPPTHFSTSKYTHAYQEIVNAYGIAHYREVNPAVFTLVTFPFLFGIMFGDIGHGIFLLAFSLALIYNERSLSTKKLNEIVQMPFDGRYVLVIMSCYAIYSGFIYNELFSVPVAIFPSSFRMDNKTFDFTDPANTGAAYDVIPNQVYPLGVDYMWKGSPNELDYYNSFKMKLSILLGILQMSLGIFISAMNYVKQKSPNWWIDFFFQFIPQITFLWSIFGYMCILVIIKWCTAWDLSDPPPSILPIIINMFLSASTAPPKPFFFSGQHGVQVFLAILAIICIPVMLLTKPLLLRHFHKKSLSQHHRLDEEQEAEGDHHNQHGGGGGGGGGGGHGHGDGEFEFGEVMIHQIIHTIEFVLGAISNTASYLRLWALSLAHSELSTVFWNRVLIGPLQGSSWIIVFAGWSVWAGATFAVLLIMETLSAFLHALRLHWVEFQNKFYLGDGVRFVPFSFKKILAGAPEE